MDDIIREYLENHLELEIRIENVQFESTQRLTIKIMCEEVEVASDFIDLSMAICP